MENRSSTSSGRPHRAWHHELVGRAEDPLERDPWSSSSDGETPEPDAWDGETPEPDDWDPETDVGDGSGIKPPERFRLPSEERRALLNSVLDQAGREDEWG